ncbi:MAG TPA: hypothetical protein VIY69_16735 [Candidatus Acidoferrales bacterium]
MRAWARNIIAGLKTYGVREGHPRSGQGIEMSEDSKSKDLQITMMHKQVDRFGEVDVRVVSIDRRRSDPSPFNVPSDYELMP